MRTIIYAGAVLALAPTVTAAAQEGRRPMVVVDEQAVRREEPTPHGKIGTSTAYRISDGVPGRTMEFRKRVLHPGAAIGVHLIEHDEVYYVLSGRGEVESGGERRTLGPGMAAYLYSGERVGIRQMGAEPLALIVSYPVVGRGKATTSPSSPPPSPRP